MPSNETSSLASRSTSDTYITVHLWIERSTPDLRGRIRAPFLRDDYRGVGLDDIQVVVAAAVDAAAHHLNADVE